MGSNECIGAGIQRSGARNIREQEILRDPVPSAAIFVSTCGPRVVPTDSIPAPSRCSDPARNRRREIRVESAARGLLPRREKRRSAKNGACGVAGCEHLKKRHCLATASKGGRNLSENVGNAGRRLILTIERPNE